MGFPVQGIMVAKADMMTEDLPGDEEQPKSAIRLYLDERGLYPEVIADLEATSRDNWDGVYDDVSFFEMWIASCLRFAETAAWKDAKSED